MYVCIKILRKIFSNTTIIMIILVALFTLLIDGPGLKEDSPREYKIVKIISYSYLGLGMVMWIFLKLV